MIAVGWASSLRLRLQLLLLEVVMLIESCSGLYRDQRVVLSRGVRGYISCPALAEPPATLIVWTRNGQVRVRSLFDRTARSRRIDAGCCYTQRGLPACLLVGRLSLLVSRDHFCQKRNIL